MSKKKKEFFHFTLVGFLATAIDYGLLNLLTHVFGLNPVLSNIISTSISSTFSYILNRKVVFKGKQHNEQKTLALYVGTVAVSILVIQSGTIFLLGRGVLQGLLSSLGLGDSLATFIGLNLAKLIGGLGTYVWNFLIQRRFVFKSHDETKN
jgi:putative flippase GtrA